MVKTVSLLGNTDQQLQRYKQAFDVMPAGVILLDAGGFVAEANPESIRLLGEPLIRQKWLNVIERAFCPQEDDGHEVSLRDGRKVKLATSASSLGQLILVTDMTETRLLQSRISYLQRFSSLGKMIAALAHQIRTPLSAALLYAANLAVPNLILRKQRQFQAKLVNRLQDIEKQVNDMLFFAKGGGNKVVHYFSVATLLVELKPMIEAVIIQHQVNFDIQCADESLELYGNANALANALSNLIINAVQSAGKACKVSLVVQSQGEQLHLRVLDNGPGIALEAQQQILEPFFTTRKDGTGLGLTVVQMICHSHQGSLQLQSQLGKGSRFTLQLPLVSQKSRQRITKEMQNASS